MSTNPDLYGKLKEAERNANNAQNEVTRAKREVELFEAKIHKVLTVGANKPISAGLLPSGKVAVIIKTNDDSPNQLQIVELYALSEDGSLHLDSTNSLQHRLRKAHASY